MSAVAIEGRENFLTQDAFLSLNPLSEHHHHDASMDHHLHSTTPKSESLDPMLSIPQLHVHMDAPLSVPSTAGSPNVVDPSLLAPGSASTTPAPSGESSSSHHHHHSSSSSKVKKRKSWGQELPEPKTNLPPRKRAKTEDEKEQRRIERVKRNRLAAHNSRERKRQEMDELMQKNSLLEQQIQLLQAELQAVRSLIPGGQLPQSLSFKPVQMPSNASDTYSSPSVNASGSVSTPSVYDDAVTPATEHSTQPPTPFETSLDASHLLSPHILALDESDQTQHSAAMLCDLQCRSANSKAWNSMVQRWQQALAIFSLILLPLQLSVMTTLSTTCSTFIPSTLRQRLVTMTTQARRTPAMSLLSRSLRALSTSQALSLTQLMSLMASPLLCTPTQAPRRLSSATGVASQQLSLSLSSFQMLSGLALGPAWEQRLRERFSSKDLRRLRQTSTSKSSLRKTTSPSTSSSSSSTPSKTLMADIKNCCDQLDKELRRKTGAD